MHMRVPDCALFVCKKQMPKSNGAKNAQRIGKSINASAFLALHGNNFPNFGMKLSLGDRPRSCLGDLFGSKSNLFRAPHISLRGSRVKPFPFVTLRV